ncbi:unnamed protein product [Adineta steineri]|uniref:Nicotianamine synthase n=1 Tax=Adineta steineri TaxID=433720 RepID=A0A815QZ17_9BILA|nr:unnamed protein product [Adineta steineri]
MEFSLTKNFIRKQLIQFNSIISQFDLLDPSPQVTHLFNELLIFCCSTPICSLKFERMLETDSVLKTVCENLRNLRSRYEYHLEIHSAKIYASNANQSLIEHFFDDGDYHRLIQLEIDMLRNLGIQFPQNLPLNDKLNSVVTKIAFIGSGPIPVSSMLILTEHTPFVDIYNIDISHEANQLASNVSKQLLPSHLFERMHFITQDINQKPLPFHIESILKQCQVIFLAALVGTDDLAKLSILQNIVKHSKNESDQRLTQHIIIRTTDGLRQVLYPKINLKTITKFQLALDNDELNNKNKASLEIQAISSPQDHIPITIIVAKIT